MPNTLVTIKNNLGLHTRAAAKLVALANQFESKIQLKLHEKTADCKSIMAIILLGATKGLSLELITIGPDEAIATDAMTTLFNTRFGEPE